MIVYIDGHLSSHLCGYRREYNLQYALVAMTEKWKRSLLEKDTINHGLLIAKLEAYGFDNDALHVVLDNLSDRWYGSRFGPPNKVLVPIDG